MNTDTNFKPLADIEWTGEAERFDMTRVYINVPTSGLFYATDAGHVGEAPFASITAANLRPITTVQDWDTHVAGRVTEVDPASEYETPRSAVEAASSARTAIADALRQ